MPAFYAFSRRANILPVDIAACRGEDRGVTGTTAIILRRVTDLGYAVSLFGINGTSELHAVPLKGGEPHIARCNDGDGEDEVYRAACLLATAVGIELEDG